MGDSSGARIDGGYAMYEPFGAFSNTPPGTNPSVTDRGFTGHRQNNTGAYDLKLIYMNARYYHPQLGRFVSPDTIVPDPANPQSHNRYAYAYNSPLKYTDPSGHCVFVPPFDTIACAIAGGATISTGTLVVGGAAAILLTVAIADALNPDSNFSDRAEDAAEFLTSVSEEVSSQISYHLSKAFDPKPLTEDEKRQIDKIDQIPSWLDKHPDLAEDAEKVANDETLPEGNDHVEEAYQRIESLDRAIKHLESVRRHRNEEAQALIDTALENARRYRQELVDIVGELPHDR